MSTNEGAVPPLRVVSSMATRALLAGRIDAFRAATGAEVRLTAVGGVDAARRVRDGEAFDVVVLARDALATLAAEGHVGPVHDWVDSDVSVAVPAGAPRPDLSTEAAVRDAVVAAQRIGVSTGPSGVALTALFQRWGLGPAVAAKTVQAPAGVPVATLLAKGEVDVGFQQTSELLGADGIEIVGGLPPAIRITTTFSAAVGSAATDPRLAARFVRALVDASGHDAIRRHGMAPTQELAR